MKPKPVKVKPMICLSFPDFICYTGTGRICRDCGDYMFYRDGRYKCYSCSRIVLKTVPKLTYTNLERAFRHVSNVRG